jgi:Uma2 family endonuclease
MTLATAKRFTITEYHRLADLDFFTEDGRVELIKGEIIKMAAKGRPHSVCNTRLYRELFKLLEEKATIRGQEPIIINDSEPEPDLTIVKNTPDDYFWFFRTCYAKYEFIYPITHINKGFHCF